MLRWSSRSRQPQRRACRIKESSQRALRVERQSLSQWQRILREEYPEHERVPAVRFGIFNGAEVALHESLVVEGAELAELTTSDGGAGGAELAQP